MAGLPKDRTLLTPTRSPRTMTEHTVGSYTAIPTEEPEKSSKRGRRSSFVDMRVSIADLDLESDELTALDGPVEEANQSLLAFVDMGWFHALAASVIIVNIVTIIMVMDDPSKKDEFFIVDNSLLAFYIFELLSRMCYLGGGFFCGQWKAVLWNTLDFVVVLAGVMDSWVMPLLPESCKALKSVLQTLRMLRIFRALKIIRIFLESDLSWTEEPKFQSFIGVVIGFNSVLMGAETDTDWSGWFYIEQVLLAIYVFELTVRLKRDGCLFFSLGNDDIIWNLLDFIIVASSTMDTWVMPFVSLILRCVVGKHETEENKETKGVSMGQAMMLMRMLRLMRILRLVKLVKAVRPLYILVTGVAAAVQGVMWVLALVFTVIYALGIVATRLIGHGMIFTHAPPPEVVAPFANVAQSMFTLFRAMSGASSEEEQVALEEVMKASPMGKFAFAFFMITSSWTLLSILTAVVSENMISTTGDQEQEMKIISAEMDRQTHMAALRKLFKQIDNGSDGVVQQPELDEFLEPWENQVNTAKICRVPVRDVRDVLRTLYLHEKDVTVDTFVEALVDVGRSVTERSVMKIETLITTGNAKIVGLLQEVQHQMETKLEACEEQMRDRLDACNRKLQQMDNRSASGISGIQRSVEANQSRLAEFDERNTGLAQTLIETQRHLELQIEIALDSIRETGARSFRDLTADVRDDLASDRCVCENADMADADFCRECGKPRANAAWSTRLDTKWQRLEQLHHAKFREHGVQNGIDGASAADATETCQGPIVNYTAVLTDSSHEPNGSSTTAGESAYEPKD